jgi:hypothetical protein
MADKDPDPPETTHDVLMSALMKVSDVEAPTPREVLQIVIRFEAARAGLPAPDFDCYPPGDVIRQVLFPNR